MSFLGDSVALVALLRYVAGTVGTGPAVAVLMLVGEVTHGRHRVPVLRVGTSRSARVRPGSAVRSNRSRPRGRPYSDGVWAMEITGCPSCGAPAEVEPWSAMASTSGPLAHVKTFCVNRHSYLMPRDMLAMPSGPDELRSAW